MKRFYKLVSVHRQAGGFEIQLDGRPVKMPGGGLLLAPTRALADAMMGEWATQDTDIIPDTMPLTQIMTTALERVGRDRAAMTHLLLAYLNTDLICYRTDHEVIAARQVEAWDPWLIWFDRRFGVALAVTDRLRALTQPQEAQDAVRAALEAMDDLRFTVVQLVASLTGSLVLGMAFGTGEIRPDEAFRAANIDEIYKSELYREDVHGKAPQQEQHERAMRRDLEAAAMFLRLVAA